MANILTLDLNNEKEISIGKQSENIISNISNAFSNAVKKGNLKNGLESGLDIVINTLKLPITAKTLLKNGKNLILDQVFEDELKKVMTKQKNTISSIDKKCVQMEEAFNKNDTKTLDRIAKTLKTDLEKVMPIQDVITKGNNILNQYKLYKNKGSEALSQIEKELCQKLS